MSKELEALEGMFNLIKSQGSFEEAQKYYDILEQALLRLESIDNANPSEALECVNDLENFYIDEYVDRYDNNLQVIKQALLKAQEQEHNFKGSKEVKIEIPESGLMDYNPVKHYLKWEDLEFKKTSHKLKAKMNDSLYRIEWYIDGMGSKVVCLDKYITNDYLIHSACIKDYNQQFFNDLHLERVEE